MTLHILVYALGVPLVLLAAFKGWRRLQLSQAKYPSLSGHSKWSRRLARLVPFFTYSESELFACDGALQELATKRRTHFYQLARELNDRSPEGATETECLTSSISDLQFTKAYRVPFPFREFIRSHIPQDNLVTESAGAQVKDLDGNWSYDLSGSYGVNVFGYDFYKDCLTEGYQQVGDLGPVLGPYHPVMSKIVQRLQEISGLDEVSFHMSGTEAVMQAVRLARYHTGRSHVVRFCGAYHGWWDGVQPGVGNQRVTNDVYTLADMNDKTLKVLSIRTDIACVLVNPLQALHPNKDPSGDGYLLDSSRSAGFDKAAYAGWLQRLKTVCNKRGIVLIFDEVFTGFRLAYRGAQEFFGVQADIVTYGKTLGGGLPVGVVCGRADLMRRYRDDQPANVSFARGTFNSHPCVLGSMWAFLEKIESPEIKALYKRNESMWNQRVTYLNAGLWSAGVPVQIENLTSVWTVVFTKPSRFNWMLQFYLRSQGLHLSWVGTGRIIMSLNYSDEDFYQVVERFVAAAMKMKRAGWWEAPADLTNKSINRMVMTDMLCAKLPKFVAPRRPLRETNQVQSVT